MIARQGVQGGSIAGPSGLAESPSSSQFLFPPGKGARKAKGQKADGEEDAFCSSSFCCLVPPVGPEDWGSHIKERGLHLSCRPVFPLPISGHPKGFLRVWSTLLFPLHQLAASHTHPGVEVESSSGSLLLMLLRVSTHSYNLPFLVVETILKPT
jgi:hypothetical protein